MKSKEKDDLIFVRLHADENIYEELENVCKKHDVKTAMFVSALGQLKDFKLGYYRGEGDYAPQEFNGIYELLSLSGSVSKQNDEYKFHLHAVLGDEKKNTVGGHLIEGIVESTNEIVLLKSDIGIKRRVIGESGNVELILE